MNPGRLLMLPWMALSTMPRRVVAGLACAAVVLAVVACVLSFRPETAWALHAMHALVLFDILGWATVLSQSLLLAREAHQLRLPRLEREACASLCLYAVATVALPALLLNGLVGGTAATAMVELAFGAGIGMAYAALPPQWSLLIVLVPMASTGLAHGLALPGPGHRGFLAWAAPGTAALWLVLGWHCRRLIRDERATRGNRMPLLLRLRSALWYGRGGDGGGETRLVGQRSRWMQPGADLRGCGPGHPVRSLRLALGGWSMPQTPASRVRQAGLAVAALLFGALILLLSSSSPTDYASILSASGGGALLLFYLATTGPLLVITHMKTLQRRWNRPNAELPLLALLPGLGDAARRRRALLDAALRPTLGVQAVVLLAIALLAVHLRLAGHDLALLLLGQLAGMGMTCASGMAVMGGAWTQPWRATALMILGYLLINAGNTLASPLFDDHPGLHGPAATVVLAVLWASFLVPLLRLGLRGWRGLRRRPHPFLAN